MQKLILEGNIAGGYNTFFLLLSSKAADIKALDLRVKLLTPALDGRFFRALSLAPVMRELSLINVRFSTNGITRLA